MLIRMPGYANGTIGSSLLSKKLFGDLRIGSNFPSNYQLLDFAIQITEGIYRKNHEVNNMLSFRCL